MSEEELASWKAEQRELVGAWEKGWQAGRRSAVSGLPTEKNPYGVLDPPEKSGPPPFPEFTWSIAERMDQPFERWTRQMREFKAAWDEWSRGLR